MGLVMKMMGSRCHEYGARLERPPLQLALLQGGPIRLPAWRSARAWLSSVLPVPGGTMFGRRNQSSTAQTAILREELSAQREATQGLVERYEVQVRNVRTAVLAVGKAREERDEYRRVLAASIATDSRRGARVEALEQERLRLEALAMVEVRTATEEGARRRELGERLERLEARLTEELAARERAVGDAADRAWAEREASREDLVRLVASHRGEVTAALAATQSELASLRHLYSPGLSEASVHPLRRVRTGALLCLSLLSTLAALALIPPTVLSIGDPERALFVHLASGLGPWHLAGAVVLSCAAAVSLLSWALRDIEHMRDAMGSGRNLSRAKSPAEQSSAKQGAAPTESSKPLLREVELSPAPPAGRQLLRNRR